MRETFAVKGGFVIGRNDLPGRLLDWWVDDRFESTDEFREALTEAWTGAEWPGRALARHNWLAMFRQAGFISDTGREKPAEPMTVYDPRYPAEAANLG